MPITFTAQRLFHTVLIPRFVKGTLESFLTCPFVAVIPFLLARGLAVLNIIVQGVRCLALWVTSRRYVQGFLGHSCTFSK